MSNDNKRAFYCPKCGTRVKLPFLWRLGVEIVFSCPECRARFRTGFKMGALLSALSLTAALVLANLLIFILSSFSTPVVAVCIIPLWLYIAYKARLWWLRRRYKK